MSTGLVRAAFCSILTESVDLSERNKKVREDVRLFLDQLTENCMLKKFDDFATSLFSAIEQSVSSCISAAKTCRAKSVLREKLWRSFHQIRAKKLRDIWSKFYSVVKRKRFDPSIEQQVNVKLFEGVLKTYFEVPSQAAIAMNASLQPQELF